MFLIVNRQSIRFGKLIREKRTQTHTVFRSNFPKIKRQKPTTTKNRSVFTQHTKLKWLVMGK